MANKKINSTLHGYKYAEVDTAPDSDGFGTDAVTPSEVTNQHELLNFSMRDLTEGAEMSVKVTLQFQCDGDERWTDYDEYETVGRFVIEGRGLKVQWRAIVKENDYTSGVVRFGFDF